MVSARMRLSFMMRWLRMAVPAKYWGDAQLRDIAKVLLEQVRRDATIDWAERKNVQAKLKVNVKKTLAKYGYPPDQQALATDMVLEQAKRYGNEWSQKRAVYDAGGASLLD